MITQQMSAAAESAAERYGMLVESWRLLFQQALAGPGFGSPKMFASVTEQAYGMARAFLEREQENIIGATTQIVTEALGATFDALRSTSARELTDAAHELVSASESYLQTELSIQIERDIAFLQNSLRKVVLQVAIAARAQNIPAQHALVQYRIGNTAELHFFFHDRGNQKWPSRKFVRAVWRHHLLSVYNEVTLLTLADHGETTAMIQHVNPKSDSHGMIIAMSSDTQWPTYAEIRNELFHPNSDAVLTFAGDA